MALQGLLLHVASLITKLFINVHHRKIKNHTPTIWGRNLFSVTLCASISFCAFTSNFLIISKKRNRNRLASQLHKYTKHSAREIKRGM